MASTASRVLGDRVREGLIVGVLPAGIAPDGLPFPMIVGGHPTPTQDSERGGRAALDVAAALQPGEALVVLLSGGASALMAVPADGVSLEDKQATTRQLLRAGADIHALNTVRKHLSAIKGGWLAARAPGPCRTFAISDVVGDDLSVIGSGPTVADTSTFRDALDILRQFGGEQSYPAPVIARVTAGAAGRIPETPKPGDARLERAETYVIGGRREAMDGAVREAQARGYHVVRMDDAVVGEARVVGPSHLRACLAAAATVGRPACFVSSGETTVRVIGDGKGGRNQEFALACAEPLAAAGVTAVVASVGTDGIDGPTDAAGAITDSTTMHRAVAGHLRLSEFLHRNDAHAFFSELHDLIVTGPTGTNVGDLQLLLVG
jgi:glycerate 2-kinase